MSTLSVSLFSKRGFCTEPTSFTNFELNLSSIPSTVAELQSILRERLKTDVYKLACGGYTLKEESSFDRILKWANGGKIHAVAKAKSMCEYVALLQVTVFVWIVVK